MNGEPSGCPPTADATHEIHSTDLQPTASRLTLPLRPLSKPREHAVGKLAGPVSSTVAVRDVLEVLRAILPAARQPQSGV